MQRRHFWKKSVNGFLKIVLGKNTRAKVRRRKFVSNCVKNACAFFVLHKQQILRPPEEPASFSTCTITLELSDFFRSKSAQRNKKTPFKDEWKHFVSTTHFLLC